MGWQNARGGGEEVGFEQLGVRCFVHDHIIIAVVIIIIMNLP